MKEHVRETTMKVTQGMALTLGAGILLAVGTVQAQESFVISGPLDVYIDLATSEKKYGYTWEATVNYEPTISNMETYHRTGYDQSFFYDSIHSIEYAIYDADANLVVAGVERADVGNVVSVVDDRDPTDSIYDAMYWYGSDTVSTVRTQVSIGFIDSSSTMVSSVTEYPSPPSEGEYDQGGSTFYLFNSATGEGYEAHGRLIKCGCEGGEEVPEEPEEPEVSLSGRMTGGGSIFAAGGVRVTHGFQLRCDSTDPRQNLQINWDRGNKFHLTSLSYVSCTDDPSIDPENPTAPFDTYSAIGEGRCNGVEGASVMFTFQDAGEPGVDDYAEIVIEGCPAGKDVTVSGLLRHGNHQAHRDK